MFIIPTATLCVFELVNWVALCNAFVKYILALEGIFDATLEIKNSNNPKKENPLKAQMRSSVSM